MPLETEPLTGIFSGGPPPFLRPNLQGTIDVINPGQTFYHDLLDDERAKAVAHLVHHPTIA